MNTPWSHLCSPIRRSTKVVAAPGNAGMAQQIETQPLDVSDPAAVATLGRGFDLVVIGPEVPLVAGAVDACREAGILAFGPTAAAAQLEGSKDFAKQIMVSAGIPTAESKRCPTPKRRPEPSIVSAPLRGQG